MHCSAKRASVLAESASAKKYYPNSFHPEVKHVTAIHHFKIEDGAIMKSPLRQAEFMTASECEEMHLV
eukprot:511018-Amphidinium_carterae.1